MSRNSLCDSLFVRAPIFQKHIAGGSVQSTEVHKASTVQIHNSEERTKQLEEETKKAEEKAKQAVEESTYGCFNQ